MRKRDASIWRVEPLPYPPPAPRSSPARPFQHTAYCCGHTVLPCGDVDTCHMSRLLHLVRRLEADRRTAHRKHKYGGRTEPGNKGQKGFQRTPAFMHSVVMDALEGLWSGVEHAVGQGEEGGAGGGGVAAVPGTLPRGGFCDVGRHTGGDAGRDTAWPLVREVLQVGRACVVNSSEYDACCNECMALQFGSLSRPQPHE